MSDYTEMLLTACIVIVAYFAWYLLKDLPFFYITQSAIPLCMTGFCSGISNAITAVIVYMTYIHVTGLKNAFDAPVATGLKGAAVGAAISTITALLNILFGFIRITGIDVSKLYLLPSIVIRMLFTGITEETIYRSLPINALAPYIGVDAIVWLSSFVFGYVHSGYSLFYGVTAFITCLLLGYGLIKNSLYWAIGLHSTFNTVETSFYTVAEYKVTNKTMAGERKTPDDDGLTSAFVTAIFLLLQHMNYI